MKLGSVALFTAIIISFTATVGLSQAGKTPKQEKLLNGLKILLWSDAKADKVSVKLRIHAGAAFDPMGREGLMQMLAGNLFPNDAAKEFFSDDLGGGLEIVTTYDYIQINASTRPEDFLTMLETIASAVSKPNIDKETTARLRAVQLASIVELEMDPAYVADQAAAHRLLDTFPYGRPLSGTAASVEKIEFPDLLDASDRFLTSDNATISMEGNFDRSLGLKAIKRYFGGWLKSDKRVPSTFRQPDAPLTALLVLDSPKPGVAAIRFAARGVARADKDLFASLVFSSILESRLKGSVPSSHTGDVFVQNMPHALPGIVMIGFSSGMAGSGAGDKKFEANDLVSKSLSDPITDAEFQAAKAAVKTTWDSYDAASFWLDADTYKTAGADADAKSMNNVSIADVRSYAEKFRKLPIVSVLVNTPARSDKDK